MKPIATLIACMTLLVPLASSQEPKAGDLHFESTQYLPANGDPVEAEIGTLWVPALRSNPESSLYKLTFVRFKSTSENPESPIIYLAGGPGGSGIESARDGRFPLFMAMREFGDVIAFDQRGTGSSEPKPIFTTQSVYPLDRPIELDDYVKPLVKQISDQLEVLQDEGIDLRSFTTEESADDLNDLRIALGADKISLWGISYGTHLALSTIRRHGEIVDRAILAGLEGPDHSLKLPSDQQSLLEDIARRVADDSELRQHVPDLMKLIQEVLETLERNPVVVSAYDVETKSRVDVLVDKWTMQFHTASLLGTASSIRGIPQLYYNASKGDLRSVGSTALRIRKSKDEQYAMSLLMDCASGATADRKERVQNESENTLLGSTINFTYPEICAACPDLDLGDQFRGPITSDVDALFISGTLDGRTSVANALELIPGFSNAKHLIIDGAGHSDELFLSSPDILLTMQEFMRGGTLSTTRIELSPLSFAKPRAYANRISYGEYKPRRLLA